MMMLRRGLMAQMAQGAYKIMHIKAEATISQNAELVADWLKTIKPDANYMYVLRDDQELTGSLNGQMFMALLISNVPFCYLRNYSGARQQQANWTSAYYLTVNKDDMFTVLYQ